MILMVMGRHRIKPTRTIPIKSRLQILSSKHPLADDDEQVGRGESKHQIDG